jgi:hypothetical protein
MDERVRECTDNVLDHRPMFAELPEATTFDEVGDGVAFGVGAAEQLAADGSARLHPPL